MLYYKQESFNITGAAMHVYNTLGPGFLEAVYQEALELEFVKRNISYEREKELTISYDGIVLKQTYRADFVCFFFIIKHPYDLLDLCSLFFYFIEIGIWFIWIKNFVAIHNCYQVFCVRKVDDIVGVTREHDD